MLQEISSSSIKDGISQGPDFSPEDLEYFKMYFEMNKRHLEEINTKLNADFDQHPYWGPIMKSIPDEVRKQQADLSLKLLNNGIYHNEWQPYIQNLSMQGTVYAKMDISFSRWYELVTITRSCVAPYIMKEFGHSSETVAGVLNSFAKITDFAMQVLTDAYLKEKNATIKAQQERQDELIKELENFAYIVSHDLKTPLRGIAKISEWVLADYGENIGSEGKQQLVLMKSRVQRLDELIDGILSYSKLGRLKENKIPLDINKVIKDAKTLLLPSDVVILKAQDKFPTVIYEQAKLVQVFTNLIGNAIKYNDKDQCVVTISCTESPTEYTFTISDNGPGIEEKYHEKVFKMFQTLNTRSEKESTGLGLTIVKKIIESEGGKIWIKSEPGNGASFVFTIPKVQ